MTWTRDPQLGQMFREELDQRSSALAEGAVAYAARDFDASLTTDMCREGHSVKGTARVMGFETIGDAGALLEKTWRLIDGGNLEWDADVADALIVLAEALPESIDAAGITDTDELTFALQTLEAALEALGVPPSPSGAPPAQAERRQPLADPVPFDVADVEQARASVAVGHETPEELSPAHVPGFGEDEDEPSTLDMLRAKAAQNTDSPARDGATKTATGQPGARPDKEQESTPVPRPSTAAASPAAGAASPPRRRRSDDLPVVDIANLQSLTVVDGFDVGGLLGAVQDWATGQTVTVGAGQLYRMINGVAALRVEAEAILHKAQSSRVATGHDPGDLAGHLSSLVSELAALEQQSLDLTAVPIGSVLATLPQLVGFLSRRIGRQATFESTGGHVRVDRAIIDAIGDPIRQLVVNSILHGIEAPDRRTSTGKPTTGTVSVDVEQLDGQIQVTVADDGAGIDWAQVGREAKDRGLVAGDTEDPQELLPVLFSEGFSTAEQNEFGGAGNGLAATAGAIEALLGRMSLRSEAGRGTIARFTVPTTRALQRIVIVEDGGLRWGLPDTAIDQIIPLAQADVDWDAPQPKLRIRGATLPLYAISQVVGGGTATLSEILVVSHRTGTAAFAVGRVDTVREVATKELGPLLQGPKHITGAALLGAGDLVLVLDPFELVERAEQGESSGTLNGPRLLIVDDSPGVRAVVTAALSSNGFVTSSVSTVAEALEHLAEHHVDAIVVDFQMPGEDGISLLRKVRANDPALPIVMLSAVADVEDQKMALESGANAVLEKSDLREGALAATLYHLITTMRRVDSDLPAGPALAARAPYTETPQNETTSL